MFSLSVNLLEPKRGGQSLESQVISKYRHAKRSVLRTQRNTIKFLRKQYYLSNALADSRTAIRRNEDITLAILLIIGIISFSSISMLANSLYTLVLVADTMATLSGMSLALLTLVTVGVPAMILLWLAAFLQNSLSIALMEGLTRKRNRSLRRTLREGLRHAARSINAWLLLLSKAFLPMAATAVLAAYLIDVTNVALAAIWPVLALAGVLCALWTLRVFATYTLAPYILLYEPSITWKASLRKSRQLVSQKGRVFLLYGYLLFILSLVGLYAAVMQFEMTLLNSTLLFLMLSTIIVSIANAGMTAFYRKRKLARR